LARRAGEMHSQHFSWRGTPVHEPIMYIRAAKPRHFGH
jgi:hypothetical protein